MKITLVFAIGIFTFCPFLKSSAQKISVDSLKIAIEQCIAEPGYADISKLQLGTNYFIDDIVTRQSIIKKTYGIFEFGLYGDDVDRWIMWYDSSGYHIYNRPLDIDMLGDILAFLARNQYSAIESYYYIKSLYDSCYDQENSGW